MMFRGSSIAPMSRWVAFCVLCWVEYKLHWVQTTRSPVLILVDKCLPWTCATDLFYQRRSDCFLKDILSSIQVGALPHHHGPIPRMLWLPFTRPLHEWPLSSVVLIEDQVKINNDLTSGLRWLRNFCHKFKEARPNINILLWGPKYQIRSPGRNGDRNLNWVL